MGVVPTALVAGALCVGVAPVSLALERGLLKGATELGPAVSLRARADRRPERRDAWLFVVAPFVAVVAVAWAIALLPISAGAPGAGSNVGAFAFIVAVDLVAVAIALGGWGANTPHGIEACYGAVAQLVAYVVPLGLAVVGPAMMARSLSMTEIVEAQRRSELPFAVVQPIGFALFVVTALMQTYRPPFSAPFASRIGHGVFSAYGGALVWLWRVALSALLFAEAAFGAVLFLGGYAGPVLPGPVWMILKSLGILVILVGVGARLRPRGTSDTLLVAWKVLVPVGLLNALAVGGLILAGVGQGPFEGPP